MEQSYAEANAKKKTTGSVIALKIILIILVILVFLASILISISTKINLLVLIGVAAILRGYVDKFGRNIPNYHYEDLQNLLEHYEDANSSSNPLANPAVIVDANHSNSGKKFEEQIRISKDVLHSCKMSADIHKLVKGLMIESYIEDGNQKVGEHCYGKSITDPCLGWEKTEKLIYELAELW